jgi:hypothetical protein
MELQFQSAFLSDSIGVDRKSFGMEDLGLNLPDGCILTSASNLTALSLRAHTCGAETSIACMD